MKFPKITREQVSVGGCFLLYSLLSTFYTYGTLYPYLASHLRNSDNQTSTTTADVELVILLDPLAQSIAIAATSNYQNRFPERAYCAVVVTLFALMWLILSFVHTYAGAMMVLGVSIGFVKGLLYLVPLYNAQRLFPKRKGMISGIMFAGYTLFPILYNTALYEGVNPENRMPYYDENTGEEYFEGSVSNRLPGILRILALVYLLIGLTGAAMLKDSRHLDKDTGDESANGSVSAAGASSPSDGVSSPPQHAPSGNAQKYNMDNIQHMYEFERKDSMLSNASASSGNAQALTAKPAAAAASDAPVLHFDSLRDALKHRVTKEIMFTFFIGIFVGYMILPSYKTFGLLYIDDDNFFQIIAWVYSIANGLGRTVWGFWFDRFDFRRMAIVNITAQLVMIGTVYWAVRVRVLYLFYIFFIYWCYGAWLVMVPALCSRMYGFRCGKRIYSIVHTAIIIAGFLGFMTMRYMHAWGLVFTFYTIFAALGLVGVIFSTFKANVPKATADGGVPVPVVNANSNVPQSPGIIDGSAHRKSIDARSGASGGTGIELPLRATLNKEMAHKIDNL